MTGTHGGLGNHNVESRCKNDLYSQRKLTRTDKEVQKCTKPTLVVYANKILKINHLKSDHVWVPP